MAGVHVRAHIPHAERIGEHLVRPANPAPVERVLPIIHHRPADARRREFLRRADDGVRDLRHERRRVIGIDATPETPHRRRRGVGVRGRDEHLLHGNAGRLRRDVLRAVDQIARHHARIYHAQRHARRAIVEHERLGEKRIGHLVRRPLGEHRVHDHRKFQRRNIHDMSARAKRLRLGKSGEREEERECAEKQHGVSFNPHRQIHWRSKASGKAV